MNLQILLSLCIAFLVTAVATPLSIPFIKRLGLIDDPKKHKHPAIIHTRPIPRGGGIPLFIGVLVTSIFFIPFNPVTLSLLLASFIALIIGTLDDKYDLSPYIRFCANILCGILVILGGISFSFITNPLGGIIHLDTIRYSVTLLGFPLTITLANVLTLLWIVWVMNMLNWSKGVDGQMPGIVAISALVIGLLSLRFPLSEQPTYIAATLSFIIAGSMLGFLLFNFHPAKLLPGYGATAMYLLLASVSLISTAKLATAILVMGVPMIDAVFTIVRRILAKKSPFQGDRKHLHHLLLDLGFSQRSIAIIYWLLSALFGAIALTLSSREKAFAIFMLAVIIGGGLLFLHRTLAKHQDE